MRTIAGISDRLAASQPFSELLARGGSLRPIRGVAGSLLAFVAAHLHRQHATQLFFVTPDDDTAAKLRDDCALILGESAVRLFGSASGHTAAVLDVSGPIARVETLQALADRSSIIVVASAAALASPVPSPDVFHRRRREVATGSETPFEPLLATLAGMGFERKDFVEEYGDIAVRGGILDVFPFVGENPVRIEFWGDTVESIREFDVLSQRSIRALERVSIVANLDDRNEGTPEGVRSSVLAYLDPKALILIHEPALCASELDELHREEIEGLITWDELTTAMGVFDRVVHSSIDVPPDAIDFRSTPQPSVHGSVRMLLELIRDLTNDRLDVTICCDTRQEVERLEELIEEEQTAPGLDRQENAEDKDASNQDLSIDKTHDPRDELFAPMGSIIAASDGAAFRPPPAPVMIAQALHSGFLYPAAHLAVLTEHEVFGRLKRRGMPRRTRFKGITAKELAQLRRGDHVVHVDYGIGRFVGLQKIKVRGVEQEVMKVLYEGDEAVYVHLAYVNRVQKYSSQEGQVPKLSRLGTPEWERLKNRARKKVKDIARDLIKLYARRKADQGFAFAPDTHWQKEMEASFQYEDTPDQAKASRDVKVDMESSSPMDRLVCGDVGFGKTEVAVRAAFKAVMNGRQVAVLVPTTILAEQHINTFIDRIGRYGVRLAVLSRFRSSKEQKQIIMALQNGSMDVVVGTHRLLSKDVRFRNLGLLVIDEEHRFGVTAKEKLRQLRATVDTLTLTATPIPRTLQFSLMGARDLSLIGTPPRNRLPIVTEIVQEEPRIVREAVVRELHRGGQVFVVHDRIHDIDLVVARLKDRIPEARFRTAHGQMKGHELETVMMEFLEKKFDVLVCTKIIESGIDIPSVNTIVINRADRFGLAELYQLRGRVGRSNVQAYAYLLTPPIAVLPKQTLRRLQAIQEFTELGSGFNLAMRDLEIRGAGNLLGAEQSGFILEMGFEMYMKIVEEAVGELREEEAGGQDEGEGRKAGSEGSGIGGKEYSGSGPAGPFTRDHQMTAVDLDVPALIPDIYIESDAERLDIYRRLAAIGTDGELVAMRDELRDRFGEYPEEVENLLGVVSLRLAASRIGMTRVELEDEQLTLALPPQDAAWFYEEIGGNKARFQALMEYVATMRQPRLQLRQDGKSLFLRAPLRNGDEPGERIAAVRGLLTRLAEAS